MAGAKFEDVREYVYDNIEYLEWVIDQTFRRYANATIEEVLKAVVRSLVALAQVELKWYAIYDTSAFWDVAKSLAKEKWLVNMGHIAHRFRIDWYAREYNGRVFMVLVLVLDSKMLVAGFFI